MPVRILPYLLVVACACAMLSMAVDACAVDKEYQLKAAFMLNFTKFIQWPPVSGPAAAFRVCVVGENPFEDALSAASGKKIGEKNIEVVHFDKLDQARNCRMVFVSRSEESELDVLAERFPDALTVSDIDGFCKDGGLIELTLRNKRLTFFINNTAMKERGFKVGSSLLQLAAEVR
ncbi:MAG: YfiR family protein [Desulfobulbaceae bacterium]|jgi:hypothetical protein|nr:YfiR family protein [Desulfobulbaceae bacterium]